VFLNGCDPHHTFTPHSPRMYRHDTDRAFTPSLAHSLVQLKRPNNLCTSASMLPAPHITSCTRCPHPCVLQRAHCDPSRYRYDADHERKRKEQLRRLSKRTFAEMHEEVLLSTELARIRQQKIDREGDVGGTRILRISVFFFLLSFFLSFWKESTIAGSCTSIKYGCVSLLS
jgi:hypothetical protein